MLASVVPGPSVSARPPIGNRPSAADCTGTASRRAPLYWRSMPTLYRYRLCLRGSQCPAWMPPSTPRLALTSASPPRSRRPSPAAPCAPRSAPSVRQLAQQHAVSISAAQQVYRCLEKLRRGEARPKSGYFVAPARAGAPEPMLDLRMEAPSPSTWTGCCRSSSGSSTIRSRCRPSTRSRRARCCRGQAAGADGGGEPAPPEYASRCQMEGSAALRQEIARAARRARRDAAPRRIVVTNGGLEAVTSRCAWPRPATPSRWSRPPTSTCCR